MTENVTVIQTYRLRFFATKDKVLHFIKPGRQVLQLDTEEHSQKLLP